MASVLVVDDEADILTLVTYRLAKAGFKVEGAGSASEAIAVLSHMTPTVIVLDVMLGDGSGFDVLQAVRASPAVRDAGVLMLSALREDDHRVRGLTLGADDYLTKPFNIAELVLRVQALARRVKPAPPNTAVFTPQVLRYDQLAIDIAGHRVSVDGTPTDLSPLEFRLLYVLAKSAGHALTRSQILGEAWGNAADDIEPNSRTVDMHMQRLRTKLGDVGDWIVTVRGIGYRFDPPFDRESRVPVR